jgi:2-methylcitrate dehydratase PrpD
MEYKDLPAAIQAQAQLILLDTAGAILSATARRYSTGRLLRKYILSQGGAPESILIGSSRRTSSVNAAFYNSTLVTVQYRAPSGAIMQEQLL